MGNSSLPQDSPRRRIVNKRRQNASSTLSTTNPNPTAAQVIRKKPTNSSDSAPADNTTSCGVATTMHSTAVSSKGTEPPTPKLEVRKTSARSRSRSPSSPQTLLDFNSATSRYVDVENIGMHRDVPFLDAAGITPSATTRPPLAHNFPRKNLTRLLAVDGISEADDVSGRHAVNSSDHTTKDIFSSAFEDIGGSSLTSSVEGESAVSMGMNFSGDLPSDVDPEAEVLVETPSSPLTQRRSRRLSGQLSESGASRVLSGSFSLSPFATASRAGWSIESKTPPQPQQAGSTTVTTTVGTTPTTSAGVLSRQNTGRVSVTSDSFHTSTTRQSKARTYSNMPKRRKKTMAHKDLSKSTVLPPRPQTPGTPPLTFRPTLVEPINVENSLELSPSADMPPSLVDHLQRLNAGSRHYGHDPYSERSETAVTVKTPSPVPVTLLGAGRIQRKKHLKRVSCYVLGPVLGEGTYGVVRDAIDTSANRMIPPHFQRVAIKTLKHRRSGADGTANTPPKTKQPFGESKIQRQEAKMRRMFETEVGNMQRFHCPNIIRAIDIFTRYGKDYVVLPIAICNLDQMVQEKIRREKRSMGQKQVTAHSGTNCTPGGVSCPNSEPFPYGCIPTSMSSIDVSLNALSFCDGGPLLSNGSGCPTLFSGALVRGIMYQLLNGVAYLHRQGLAHNDIKPQNLLLFDDGLVKLSDLGSVSEEFNDSGTPMYTSPEVCRIFFRVSDSNSDANFPSNKGVDKEVKVDAQKNDMWSCGVVLYYLLTGKYLWGHLKCQTRYQLYREIAIHCKRGPICLDGIPEPCNDGFPINAEWSSPNTEPNDNGPAGQQILTDSCYPPSTLRDLLSQLLAVDPAKRLTAEGAMLHLSLQTPFAPTPMDLVLNNGNSAVDVVKRDVAQRVLLSPILLTFIRRDQERHLQFVAECCHILGISMPAEIFVDNTSKPNPDGKPKTLESTYAPNFPCGTVDGRLFASEKEQHYYETKLNRQEHDVRFILTNPAKVRMMEDYLYNSVLVECGYFTPEEALRRRSAEVEMNQRKLEAQEARALARRSTQKPNGELSSKSNTASTTGANGQQKKTSSGQKASSPANDVRRSGAPNSKDECSKCLCGIM